MYWQAEGGSGALRSDIVTKHAKNCPWRRKGCTGELFFLSHASETHGLMPLCFIDDLYQLHLSEPPQMSLRDLLEGACSIPPEFDFNIKHPLSEDDVALLESTAQPSTSQSDSSTAHQQTIAGPSRTALITALFGWGASPPKYTLFIISFIGVSK
jgi:hypothetical protein